MNAARALAALLAIASVSAWAATAAQLKHGEELYSRCAACHSIEGNRTGPQHCGLFGRRAGTAAGFTGYSEAMKSSGTVWSERTLDRFLRDPLRAVPGTAMTYAGVTDARERADLIAWLRVATKPGTACTIQR